MGGVRARAAALLMPPYREVLWLCAILIDFGGPQKRARLARDAYSCPHVVLMVGIVWYSLGAGRTIAHPGEPLEPLQAIRLCGRVALFFAGEVAYRWREHHELAPDRLVTSIVLLSLIPVALAVPTLTTLAAVTSVGIAFIGYEHWQRPEIGGIRPRLS